MKKNLKKLLTLVMALIMVLSIVGCGGSKKKSTNDSSVNDDFFADDVSSIEDSNSDGSDTTKDDNGSTSKGKSNSNSSTSVPKANKVGGKSTDEVLSSIPKKLKGTTITMYNWNPASEYTGAPTVIKEFESKTGIKVEWKTINFEVYTTRLASLIAAGNSPDVVRTRTPSSTRLTSFQPLSACNYNFNDDAWDKVLMKDYSVNGVAYATSLKNTHLGSVSMMFYNKSLISKYDLENPYQLWKSGKWTVNKYLDICKKYKQLSKAEFASVGWTYYAWNELYGISGPIGYNGSEYSSNLKNNTYLTSTIQVADLFHNNTFGEGRAEMFDPGKCLFYAGASVYARRKNSYFGTLKSEGNLYAVPMPSVDGQSKYYQARDEYEAYGIAKGAKNPEAVPYFLRYFLDGSNYNLSNFFCNEQNLEVYNWCMSQTNTIWSLGDGGDNFSNRENGIYSKQGNQIKSFIDSNSSEIDEMVTRYNNALSSLEK